MKIHELFESMPLVQRGHSLTKANMPAAPVGSAGRAVLADALNVPYKMEKEPEAKNIRLKDFLLRMNMSQAVTIVNPTKNPGDAET